MPLSLIPALICCVCLSAYPSDLVNNGILSSGTGERPEAWRHEAFDSQSNAVKFEWISEASGPGVLKISNLKPDDSRWFQTFAVSPSTWYRVSGWIRVEKIGTGGGFGAYLADLDDDYYSPDLRGGQGWQQVEFWMKTGPSQRSVTLACRLGGYSALNTGIAYFAAISFVQTGSPPGGATRAYGCGLFDFNGFSDFCGQPSILIRIIGITPLLLIALLLLWRFNPSGGTKSHLTQETWRETVRLKMHKWEPGTKILTTRRERLLVGLGSLVFGLLFSYPVLAHISRIGSVWDWDYSLQLEWVPFWSVRHFHKIPLWSPYTCGGMPMLANPQARVTSPFFLLHLIFGLPIGLHLEIPLHLALSFLGGYLLGGVEGLKVPGRVTCAAIFPASSWFTGHIAAGHLMALSWLLLPWVVLFMMLAIEGRALSWAALGGLIVALMFHEGGVYQTSHAILLASVLCIALAATRRNLWPLIVLAAFGMFAAGFGAIKLLPAYKLMSAYPRLTDISYVDYSVRSLPVALFSRNQFFDRASIGGAAFYEYGAYVSLFAVVLIVIGLATSARPLTPWIVAALFFLVLTAGEGGFPQIWELMHKLPLFSSERVTPRFLVTFVFTLGVIAGYGADFVCYRLGRIGAVLGLALIAAAIGDAWLVGVSNLAQVVDSNDFPVVVQEFRQFATGRPATTMYPLAKSSRGDPTCYEAIPVAISAVGENEKGYRGEQYLLGPGSVHLSEWTPNALSYDIDTPASNVMVINQNYDSDWRLIEGSGEVFSQDGLIAVHLPAGSQRIKLAYRSYFFLVGAAVTVLTFVVTIVLWRKRI